MHTLKKKKNKGRKELIFDFQHLTYVLFYIFQFVVPSNHALDTSLYLI